MANNYFCCYDSYLEGFEQLGDAEVGRLIRACIIYHMSGQVVELSGSEKYIFPMVKNQIDRDSAQYEAKCKQLSDNAKKRYKTDSTPKSCKSMQMHANACKSMQGEGEGEGEGEGDSLSKRASARESAPPEIIERIVKKLNKEWHVKYSADNPAVIDAISDRWAKHPDMNDIEYVIEIAGQLWGKNPQMINALTPWIVLNDKNFERFNNALPPDDVAACLGAR